MKRAKRTYPWAVTPVLLVWSACAVNPATGERQLILMSEGREISMGREADGQISAQMGEYDDADLQAYLTDIGLRMARGSERPSLPWSFKVMDDPIVNAFALPGGFIYITRGIMAHFESEAELAAVVGHEIGHVTGRHSAEQLSRAQLAQVGLVAGMVLGPEQLQPALGAAAAGLGLLFLKFGRDDERQADDLGLRYMTRAGYDAREMPNVFAMLGRVSAAAGGGRVPEWLSTHPNPENREQHISDAIVQSGQSFEGAIVNRDGYLDRLDGMVFGDDPRDGFFEERQFYHPRLAFQLTFPAGWQTQNQKQAVVGINADQNALVQLTLSSEETPSAAAQGFAGQDAINAAPFRRTSINGLPAVTGDFTASANDQTIRGTAAFIAHGDRVFQLLGYGTTDGWVAERDAMAATIHSFAQLTDRARLDVQPDRLDIVTLERSMTLRAFNEQLPSEIELDRLALINRVEPDESMPAGKKVKRVVN